MNTRYGLSRNQTMLVFAVLFLGVVLGIWLISQIFEGVEKDQMTFPTMVRNEYPVFAEFEAMTADQHQVTLGLWLTQVEPLDRRRCTAIDYQQFFAQLHRLIKYEARKHGFEAMTGDNAVNIILDMQDIVRRDAFAYLIQTQSSCAWLPNFRLELLESF